MNPAQLWIGSDSTVTVHAENYLQRIFCHNEGCGHCTICMQIRQRQHHAILWFCPENNYTLDLLKPFFNTITRALDEQAKFFFIFQHADYLSPACSNSLLKSIEEPPPGYHMLFLAQHLHAVAPTLRSRCTVTSIAQNALLHETYDLLPFFTMYNAVDSEHFLQGLDKTSSDDRTTLHTLEKILQYWINEYKNKLDYSEQSIVKNKIKIINHALKKPPMPGSTKIFWKNLFLKMQ